MKRKLSIIMCLLLVAGMAALLLGMTAAEAEPIDYIFTGTATGFFNGDRFENKEFNILFHADSEAVVEWYPRYFLNYPLQGSISIADVVTGNFTSDQMYVSLYQPKGFVGFGNRSNGDLLDLKLPGLDSYDLRSYYGPVTTSSPVYLKWNDVALNNGDTLTFTNVFNGSFSDPPTGSAPVPEPATLLLLGSGLAGIGVLGRWRMRKRNS